MQMKFEKREVEILKIPHRIGMFRTKIRFFLQFSYSKSLSGLGFADLPPHLKLFSFYIFKPLYINNHDI